MIKLDDEGLDQLLDEGHRFLLYKHSPTCPLSLLAQRRMGAFAAGHPDAAVYWLDVIRQRPLARGAADLLGVPHASPQVILVDGGAALWDASHLAVSEGAVARAWQTSRSGSD